MRFASMTAVIALLTAAGATNVIAQSNDPVGNMGQSLLLEDDGEQGAKLGTQLYNSLVGKDHQLNMSPTFDHPAKQLYNNTHPEAVAREQARADAWRQQVEDARRAQSLQNQKTVENIRKMPPTTSTIQKWQTQPGPSIGDYDCRRYLANDALACQR